MRANIRLLLSKHECKKGAVIAHISLYPTRHWKVIHPFTYLVWNTRHNVNAYFHALEHIGTVVRLGKVKFKPGQRVSPHLMIIDDRECEISNVINIMAEPGDYIELSGRGIIFRIKKPFSMFTLANRPPLDNNLIRVFHAGCLDRLPIPTQATGKRIKLTPYVTLIKNN